MTVKQDPLFCRDKKFFQNVGENLNIVTLKDLGIEKD